MPELYQRQGMITGISYLYQNQRMAGSVLGKSYSLPGLQKIQQVSYQPEEDVRLAGAAGLYPTTWGESSLAIAIADCLDVTYWAAHATHSTMDEGERH